MNKYRTLFVDILMTIAFVLGLFVIVGKIVILAGNA
jgi:hypothetical protein